MNKRTIINKIKQLNEAYVQLRDGVNKIKNNFTEDNNCDLHIYRIEKEMTRLHSIIIKKLEKQIIDEDFNIIINDYNKKD